ncbi:MAG: Xaa-Pro peptidase family protein [Thermoplasmata archaeon]|nr:Xaa-Pro peptidase family protein [Thermoplasmata archaeon]
MQKSRAERLMENAGDMDAVVIANDGEPFLDSAFWYITEQTSGTFEGSFAIVRKDGSMDVVVSILEEEGAHDGKGNIRVYHDGKERAQFIRDALKGCTKVGFNVNNVTYAAAEYVRKTAEGIEIVNAANAIGETVSVKDEKEIEATRKACAISSKVAGEIPDMLSEGVTEKEVASRMDNRMRELGGTGNAFDTIAAFGPWSSQPHHMPCDYALKQGDAALFDFGTKYDRYCSDMTRTVFLGKPPEVMERAYEVVLRAQEAGIAEYRAGAKANAADLAARKIIDESEFKGKFIHSFGHGIGQDVHQHISVSPKSEHVLKAGNIVSAEPGIYIPGVGGIRIEDTILITEDGCERLTSFDHSLTVV